MANRLTSDGKVAYIYDANGNLIEKRSLDDRAVTTYTYDPEDRLIRVVTPKAEVTFQYDPLGRRAQKRIVRWHEEDGDREPDEDEEGGPGVIRYFYDQEDILAMFDDAGDELARYTHGPGIDEPLAESKKDRPRFYHADLLGSIIALSEKHGHPLRHYRYSAFGVPENHKGDSQPYRFTGREWDKETGLYYYRARYYDPRLGRFFQEDSLLEFSGISRYLYVLNSPFAFVDPFGFEPQVPGSQSSYVGLSRNPSAAAIAQVLERAAANYGIPADVLKALAWSETRWQQFRPDATPNINYNPVVNRGNERAETADVGLMQLNDYYNASRGINFFAAAQDIEYNITQGARILAGLCRALPGGQTAEDMWYEAVWRYKGKTSQGQENANTWRQILRERPWTRLR